MDCSKFLFNQLPRVTVDVEGEEKIILAQQDAIVKYFLALHGEINDSLILLREGGWLSEL